MIDKMSDASRILDRLEGKGLINRNPSEVDKRAVDVVISKKGLNLLEKTDSVASGFGDYLGNLNEQEIEQLNTLLDKIRD
jgi:DNA-binding MarR family transcriptional regulator